jgi:hypothetical protein
MIQVSIKKQDKITNQGLFQSMEEAQSWLDKNSASRVFGHPAQVIQEQIELSPAVIAEDGSVIEEAVVEIQEKHIPSDYEVVIEDISAKLDQEKINQEALELLASTDWLIIRELDAGIACPAEVKQARAEARAKIVK